MVCYKKEKSHLRSRLPGKSLCPQPVQKTSLSGLYCLESDCSPSFPLPSFLLRCHNGGRPGLDGGEMGVIKSDPRGAVWGWHTCGIAISPESSRPLCCRRMLLDWRNAAGDTYNYMTSTTLTACHPQHTVCVCVCVNMCKTAGERGGKKTTNIKWKIKKMKYKE